MARYIDADRLFETIQQHDYPLATRNGSIDNGMFTIGIKQAVDEQPTSDVAPVVHGHWIMRGGKRYCSRCEKRACVTRDLDDFWYTVGTDYCPNCGAKMDVDVAFSETSTEVTV